MSDVADQSAQVTSCHSGAQTDHGGGAHSHHGDGSGGPLATSFQATLHCLTGCVIGEVAGLLIGVSLGFQPWQTILLATALAYATGITLGLLPVMKKPGCRLARGL
jgi:hypothetical protein